MPVGIQTNNTRLENGVRVITERVPNTGSAGISVLVDVGPHDEPAGKNGLAHLCEHALFLGTPLRTNRELAELIDAAGGCFGGFTAPDYTCFYSHVLEDYVSYAIDLLGDILVASKYPEELLEREKDVIRQEILGSKDNTDEVLLQLTKECLWPEDSLSKSITGEVADMDRLDRSDVARFISRQYSPDRIIIAVAGGVEHESVVEQVQDAFWTLRGEAVQRKIGPPTLRGGVEVKSMPTRQCSFTVALPTPPYGASCRYSLHVLNNLIGGGMSSRLYQSLREANGLVYSIQSGLLSYRRGGAMTITGATTTANLMQSIQLVLIQVTSLALWDQPINEEELWKSKMLVRSQSRMAIDVISNRVSRIATQEFHFGQRLSDDEMIEEIDMVSIEDLRQLAAEILLAGLPNLTISVVGPIDEGGVEYEGLMELRESFASMASSTSNSI